MKPVKIKKIRKLDNLCIFYNNLNWYKLIIQIV